MKQLFTFAELYSINMEVPDGLKGNLVFPLELLYIKCSVRSIYQVWRQCFFCVFKWYREWKVMVNMDRLYEKLMAYQREDYYPMHMPGHKRNTKLMQMGNPYTLDITEIEGFDNLHEAQGVLKELSERYSRLYGAGASYLLVNGSTVGILAGISALCRRGDRVLIARNCHKSVYHAVVLKELVPVYCYPQQPEQFPVYGGISVQEIEEALIKEPDIRLVVITSPTYEGMVSDIGAISETVHRHGAFLLVDEAHGAHFGFHKGFPQSAVRQGADIVIQSLHKTLPALTQSAVLHSNLEPFGHKIEQYLSIYESSSPSYLLMAGMDRLAALLEEQAEPLFEAYDKHLRSFYQAMEALKNLRLLTAGLTGQAQIYAFDRSKLTVLVQNRAISGHQLHSILRERYHIIMEMETPGYVLGMTSICDTREGFERLAKALLNIDRELSSADKSVPAYQSRSSRPVQAMTPGQAAEADSEQVPLMDSQDRISAAFICMYPPGSPLIVPGERIDTELIRQIDWLKLEGITVTGLVGEHNDRIDAVKRRGI